MKVIAKDVGFYGGSRRRVGEVFEFTGTKLGKWMVLADGSQPVKTDPAKTDGKVEPTKAEIIAQLELAGVEYDKKANKPELLVLLQETIAKIAPGASTAPDKLTDQI